MTQTQNQPKMLYIASFSELWERFSFYIVEALLVVYLIETKHLSQIYSYDLLGTYISNSFIFTIFGAYFGQYIIGFRSAVNLGALLMSVGYALLLHPKLSYLYHGLALISVGSALFKPNMACFVGSLYPRKNSPRYHAAYNIYYGGIMLGVILSTSISGYILEYYGWDVNFSLGCFCMLLALGVFGLGNQWSADREYASTPLKHAPITRWGITFIAVGILWMFMQVALHHTNIARLEILLVTLAFMACSLGFLTLIIAFWLNPTPYFLWVFVAYAFIGLGEAILAPTALAMIAELNPPSQVGIMMSSLYVFWGFGTKLADVFAKWSIFPTTLHDAESLSPYFSQAIVAYAGISIIMIVLALIGRRIFRF